MPSLLSLPPPPTDLWAEISRALQAQPSDHCRVLLCSGNYRGVFSHLRDDPPASRYRVLCIGPEDDGPDVGRVPDGVRSALLDVLAGAAAFVNPFLALAASLGNLGYEIVLGARRADAGPEPDPVMLFRDLLMAATEKGPTLLVMDSALDDEDLWTTFTYLVRHDGLMELPLVVVAGMQGPASVDVEPPERGALDSLAMWGHLVVEARDFVERDRLAEWRNAPPLDAARVRSWLGPVERSLTDMLLSISGGDDLLAAHLWARWQASGFVRRVGGVWTAQDPSEEPISREVFRVLSERLPAANRDAGRRALDGAALFGDTFSGDVVAQVVAAEDGSDPEGITDLLDELSDADPGRPWLVSAVDCIRVQGPDDIETFRWRYRFASRLVASWLRGVIDPQKLTPLVEQLLQVGMDLHTDDSVYWPQLTGLARYLGKTGLVADMEGRAAAAARLGHLVMHARVLLAVSQPARDDSYLAERLVAVVDPLITVGFSALAVEVGKRGVVIAERGTSAELLARAHYYAGMAFAREGLTKQAHDHLLRSVGIVRRLFRETPTSHWRRELAIMLHALGGLETSRGNYDEAAGLLNAAREHNEMLFGAEPTPAPRRELAITLHALGDLETRRGNYDEAARLLNAAREHNEVLFGAEPTPALRRELAGTLHALGDLETRRGNHDEAARLLNAAREHTEALFGAEPTPALRRGLAITLHALGDLETRRGNHDEAARWLNAAREHYEVLFGAEPTPALRRELSAALHALGALETRRGNYDEAVRWFTAALNI